MRTPGIERRCGHLVQSMAKDLWALDFDGVVCNSVGESSQSAWKVHLAVTLSPLCPRCQ